MLGKLLRLEFRADISPIPHPLWQRSFMLRLLELISFHIMQMDCRRSSSCWRGAFICCAAGIDYCAGRKALFQQFIQRRRLFDVCAAGLSLEDSFI